MFEVCRTALRANVPRQAWAAAPTSSMFGTLCCRDGYAVPMVNQALPFRATRILAIAMVLVFVVSCGTGDAPDADNLVDVDFVTDSLSANDLPPAGWTCEARWWGEGWCDCGCGVLDVNDCDDASIYSCVYNACRDAARPKPSYPPICEPLFEACHPDYLFSTQLPRRHRLPSKKQPREPKR